MPTFEDALAEALDRCSQGEPPEIVAADYPEHDILPYLQLAEQLKDSPCQKTAPSAEWMQRSLRRLLERQSGEDSPSSN
jgi:hypothetical protein